jgi:two-component system sensor histidine kinase HydH
VATLGTSTTIARWLLIAAAALMGAALIATVWATHRGVRDASETLQRGQGDVLQEAVRVRLSEVGWPPSSDDLAGVMADLEPDGLRYLALLDRDGSILVDAGTPATTREHLADQLARTRPNVAQPIGEVFRIVDRRPSRAARRPRPGRRGGPLVIEYQPRVAEGLRGSSRQALAFGALTAGGFLVLAIVLFRWIVSRQLLERRLEHGRRLASLGQMSAVLAHEIRNPLASLKGNAQLLARALPEGDKTRAKADRVVTEALRLETLTNDLLEFARTGALSREPTDPTALLREAASGMAVEIETDRAPASWPLDRERIRQVLSNLLENAAWASSGVPVRARVGLESGALVYTVRDRGPGIPEEDLPRIFEPFFTRRSDGTGLGLAVAKRIVDLHGGTIAASNPPGGGAEMRVTLPRA